MRKFLCVVIVIFIFSDIYSQNITTTYSYTWKYDTAYNSQVGTQNFAYTGSVQTYTVNPGTYTLEVWGAQGGYYSSNIGGYGGYSIGTLTVTGQTVLYIYCGGYPGYSSVSGFNGGGTGSSSYGGGGGGGSDIRVGSNSLYARVIVAGGGGGSGYNHGSGETGGYGGGTQGGTGTCASYTALSYFGQGGTQNSGGSNTSAYTGNYTSASFGQGASNTNSYYGFGGGGGWYGGGAGQYEPAGGGSGYVYTSATASYYPQGCLLNSSHYLTSAVTYAGNTSFASTTGGIETGHSGNGYARIKYSFKTIDHIDSSINHIYVTTTITDFVCKNGVYNNYGFTVNGASLSSGVHTFTNHFTYGNTDSIVCLNLTIRPDATVFDEVEAPYSYTWPINGVTYTESGIYNYTTVTAEGCDSTVILALTIYDPTIGIEENADLQDIIITPNPVNDHIDIKTTDVANSLNLTVYNIYGQICLTQMLTNSETRISVSEFPAGTYFFCFIKAGKKLITKTIIKN